MGNHQTRKHMKSILLLISVVTLCTTSGCFFVGHRDGGEYREHGEYRGHAEHHAYYAEPEVDVRIHN
jgi:hypothetical protein